MLFFPGLKSYCVCIEFVLCCVCTEFVLRLYCYFCAYTIRLLTQSALDLHCPTCAYTIHALFTPPTPYSHIAFISHLQFLLFSTASQGMEIDEFEDKIEQELKKYQECYDEYNTALEKTILLIEKLRARLKR